MGIRLKGRYFLGLFLLLCLSCWNLTLLHAQQKNPIPNSPTDFPPAFECVFFPNFENNFSIRRAAFTPLSTIDVVMPLVGDVTGDGYPEILIPAKQINRPGGDDDGYGRPYITSRTKNILVYRMENGVLKLIDTIITPYFSIEAPAQFVLAKVDGKMPLIILAASWDPDNNFTGPDYPNGGDYTSHLVAYRFDGSSFKEEWKSTEKYGRNVPWSSKPLRIGEIDPIYKEKCDEKIPGDCPPPRYYKFPSGAAPAVADFNRDGKPEVYLYNEIFDAATGNFIVDGGKFRKSADLSDPAAEFDPKNYLGQGISQVSPGFIDALYAGTTAVSVAADLNNDGILELAAGNTIYEVNIDGLTPTMTPREAPLIDGEFMLDGFTSIADIDRDGQLDVVVTTARVGNIPDSRRLYAWSLPSGPGIGPIKANGALKRIDDETGNENDVAISLAFIGDVNGDKKPNIGFTTPFRLWMLEYDQPGNTFKELSVDPEFSQKWPGEYIKTEDESGHTYITMFDFDQDGRQELIYRDETRLRIIDGKNGTNRSEFPSFSATANEGAIVADVDMDGEAEIIVTNRERPLDENKGDRSASMVVYKSDTKPWAPARSVWNQYAYFSFNVNQDLSIPAPQQNHARTAGQYFPKYDIFGCLTADEQPFNNFLVQTTLYNDAGCKFTGINQMDAQIEILSSRFICPAPDQSIEFVFTVRNASDAIGDATAAIPTDTPISFFVDDVLIGQYTLEELGRSYPVDPGEEFTPPLPITISSSVSDLLATNTQTLKAIINPADANGNVLYEECNYDNISVFPLISRPLYSINNPAPLCFEDASGQINSFLLTPQNTVPGSVDSDQLQWFLNDLTSAPLTNNATYTIDPTDFSLTIVGLNPRTYTYYLLDECTGVSVNTDITVHPMPAPQFTVENSACFDDASGKIMVDDHLNGYVYYVTGVLFDGSQFAEVRFDSETALENAGFKAGEYSIKTINENGTDCQIISQVTIDHPTPLEISGITEVNPECVPDNGTISWVVTGGTPSAAFPFYTYVLTNTTSGQTNSSPLVEDLGGGSAGIKNLEGGSYTLTITDEKGCFIDQAFTLITQQDPEFELPQDVVICETDEAVATVTMTNPGTPATSPSYIWGTFVGGVFAPLTNGQSVGGGSISIASDGATATFQNLSPNPAGHEFAVRIENACNQADSPFLIKVNPLPTIDVAVKNITCFGGNDGEITLTKSPSANPSDLYEYTLTETGATNTTGIFTGLVFQANPYTISIKNLATQCQTSVEATLTQAEEIVIQNLVDVSSTCMDSNGTLSATITGGVGPYEITLVQGGNELSKIPSPGNFTLTDLAEGNYELIAYDAVGCKSQAIPFTILNDNKTPIVIVLSPIETCEGELVVLRPQINTQGLPRTVTWFKDAAKTDPIKNGPDPLDPAITYNIDGENLEITGLKEGSSTFFLDVTGSDYCPIEPEEVTVTVTPALKLDLDIPDELCFGEGVTVIANASGGNGQIEYSLDGGAFQTNNSFDLVSSGTHQLIIRTNQGCSLIRDFEVVGPTAPLEISGITEVNPECVPDNGTISWVVTGGTPSAAFPFYTYVLTNTTSGQTNSSPLVEDLGGGSAGIKNLEGGSYTLTITDEKGCFIDQAFTLITQQDPEFELPQDVVICETDEAVATVTMTNPGTPATSPSYIWGTFVGGVFAPLTNGQSVAGGSISIASDGATATFQNLSPNPAGHEFALRIENACDQPDSPFLIKVNPLPTIDIAVKNITCFGGNDGEITITKSPSANPSDSYEYTLTETGTTNTTGVFTDLTFQVDPYTILVKNSSTQCFDYVEVAISQATEITIQNLIETASTCTDANGSISGSIAGGVGPYEVSLVSGGNEIERKSTANDFTFTDLLAGGYELIAYDAVGCISQRASFNILNDNKNPIDIILSDVQTCEGEYLLLQPQINTQGLPRTVSWYKDLAKSDLIVAGPDAQIPGVVYSFDGENLEITGLKEGAPITYYVDVAGTDFCPIEPVPVKVTITPGLVLDLDIPDEICFGDKVTIVANATGGNGTIEYSLDGGAFLTNNVFNLVSAGSHQIIIRNDNGCSLTRDFVVTGPSAGITTNSDSVILSSSCGLPNGEISNISVSGGYGNYTFIWKKDNVQNPVNYAEGVLELKDLLAGDYYLIITDEKGCELVVPFEVEELPDPEIVITNIAVCGSQQVTLTPVQTVSGAAPTELIWYFDAARTKLIPSGVDPTDPKISYSINSDSHLTIEGLPFGDYSYFLEVVCTGALIELKVSINENPAPIFDITDILCFGDNSGKIKISSGDNSDLVYSVNGAPSINKTSLESSNFSAGTYVINITNQKTGCTSEQTLVFTEPSELIFQPGPFVNPTCGESNGSIQFNLSGGVPGYEILINNAAISTYTFSENQGKYTLSGLAPGNYSVDIKDQNGCILNLVNQFQLVNNDGSPIIVEKMEVFICEGELASIIPKISTTSGKMPNVQWFADSALTQAITPNYTPAGTGLMYEIITGTGELRVYNLTLGSYSYYIQLSGTDFCTVSAKATVEVSPGLSATPKITDLICFGANDGKIEIEAVQIGTAVLEYSIDGITWQSQPIFENLAAGVYEITIRDKSGNFKCELKLPGLEVKGPSAPITINPDIIVQRSSCGLDNGSITNIQIQGGWGTYQIEWRKDFPTGTLISGNANSAENLVPGKYFLIVQDLEGCEEIFEFEITAQNQPLYSIIEPNDICEGESITLEALNSVSGASSTSYVWSKGPNKQNPIAEGADSAIPGVIYTFDEIDTRLLLNIQGLPAGIYTYYLFIDCTSQELLFEFEVKASPSPVIEKTDISCFGQNDGKIIVNSGGAPDFTYSVNNGTKISQAALESQNFAPGIYEILVSNSIGCSSQVYTLEIVEPAALEIEDLSFKNSACGSNDGEILISWLGGTAEYTIQLIRNGAVISSKKSSSFSTSFNNLGAGTYEVSIVDANLCSVKSLAPIELVDGPSEIIAEDVSVCVGEIAVIQPKVNPASANPLYSWYWGSISAANKLNNGDKRGTVDIQINAAGEIRLAGVPAGTSQTLVVTVSGTGICEGDEKQVVVSVKDAPEFTAVGNDVLCFGDGGSIQISSADLISLEFSLNSGPFTKYPSGLIENLAPGSYTLAGKNTTGCVTNLGQTIIINGPASALNFEDFKVLPSSCLSSDGEISGIIGGGTSPYIVSLKDSQEVKISPDIQTADGAFLFSSLLAGSYQVDVIDGNGCLISNDSIQLLDEPTVISANDVSICEGEIATIQASFSQNISNVTYNWYYDAALTQPVQLNAAADSYGAQYQSASSGRLSITSLPARNNPYSYFIQVTGQGVCPPEVKEVKVTVSPLPTLRVSNPSIVCDPNQTVDLTEFIEGYNPNIFDYKVISPTGTALRRDELSAVKTTGSYIVQAAFKGNTCFTPVERIAVVIATTQLQSSFDYQIEFANSTIVVNSDVQAFEDVDFVDTSVGEAIIWNWDFGDGTVSSEQNPTHQYLDAGEFLVKLTTIDRFGCVSEFQRVLEIFNDYQIIIPNAFTPGGVKNQYFLPKYRGISSMEFYIFTTWGELIFETNSLETLGWDGTFRGRPAMNGNYVYKAVFNTRTGEVVERAGVFVLIR